MFNRKDLTRLLIPLIIEQVLGATVGLADTLMVSNVGEAAVSGVSLVDSVNLLLINVFSALATGGTIVASQYLGRNDRENANKAANQLVLVTSALSAAIMALCLLLRRPLLNLLFVLPVYWGIQFLRGAVPRGGEFPGAYGSFGPYERN